MKYALYCVCALLAGVVLLHGCASDIAPPRYATASIRTMEATGYCKCGECCGWRRNWRFKPVTAGGKRKAIGQTASGKKARVGTIAADTAYYPFGTVMYIPGYGYGRVEDRGGDIKGPNRIDVFFKDHKGAVKWGRQNIQVKVWLPGS